MSKLYNNFSPFSTPFDIIYSNILSNFISSCHFMPLPFLKFLPSFIISLASSQSIIFDDLAAIIAPNLNISFDSASRHIKRFLSNPNYDFNFFYFKFISFVLSSFKIKHPDNYVYIAFDHMCVENRFTILMFTLRIGNSGIPLWFKSFNYGKDAYQFSVFQEAIPLCHYLIKSVQPNAKICFLADRWFGNHYKILNLIDSLDDRFDARTKSNVITLFPDKYESHPIFKSISSLDSYAFHSAFYHNIKLSRKLYSFNLTISKSSLHSEPWYIVSNKNPKRSIKNYGYRFGSIEFIFKAQKSNGFFLEETQIKDFYTFNSLYSCICITQTLLTILGIDYSKNSKCYKRYKIKTTKIINCKRKRYISYFRVGLTLLTFSLNSKNPFNLFKRLILYDI